MKMIRLFAAVVMASAFSANVNAIEYSNSIRADQHLLPGDRLTNGQGTYALIMKTDGSIARVGPNGEFWNPGVFGQELLFQWDGNLVLYDTGRRNVIWSANKGVVTPQNGRLAIAANGELQALGANDSTVLWTLAGDPKYNNPGTKNCPGGGTPQPYPACANAGTSYQFNIPIPACSPAEAKQLALASGFTPGACR